VDSADQRGGDECVEAGEDEEDEAEGEKDEVAEHEAEEPEDCDAEADVLVLLVGAGEEVPDGELFGGEALCYLVVDDCLVVYEKIKLRDDVSIWLKTK